MLRLNDRYHLEEALGQGGAGTVYRALDVKLQRRVAIKRLETTSKRGPDQGVERLRREAALLSRLAHPNIVQFYELGEADGQPYLVLEYVDGCTLRDLLEAWLAPLPIETTLHIIKGVLDALMVAHQADIIHRDLKPENIMLVGIEPDPELDPATLRPVVKVTDFGLAYLSGDVRITNENLVAGTALYLAPEAALGQVVDSRADLYALGVMLYELVAGRPPFPGHDPLVVISQHLHAAPVSPRWHNAEVSPNLAAIILKLLAKNPVDRYQTAASVLTDLETISQTGKKEQSLTQASLLEAMARGRLVGREEALASLHKALDSMMRGPGSLIFIEGVPGIGKSRLVREASVYARLKGAQVFTGHCYDAELALPYQPFIEIVKAYVQANFKPDIPGRLPASLAAELVKLAPGLETHLGAVPELPEVSPAEARLRLFEAVVTLLTRGPEPVLLILENLHWATPPDLALLLHLAYTGVRRRRLLIVITYQSGPQPPGSAHTLAATITQLKRAELAAYFTLGPLAPDQVTLLLETLLEGEVAPDFSQAIFKVTEGNPFFIEEILKTLIEEGRIFRDPARSRWEGINLAYLEIPASLKEVIDRRFEKLSQPHHQLLTLAALLGRQFRVDVLLAVAQVSQAEIRAALAEAIAMQLISRVSSPERQSGVEIYAFEHALIRQALLESLDVRRQDLHRQIAQALEKFNQTQPQPIIPPDELAYHFGMAGDDLEKVISYNLIAADNALRVYASEVAVKHYQIIIELLEVTGDVAQLAWVLEQLGDLYFHRTRQMVDASAAYEWAIQLWQNTPDPDIPSLIRLYRNMGELARHWKGYVEKLDAYLTEALGLLEADPTQAESLERARVLAARAFNLHTQPTSRANDETALTLAQTAANLAAQLNAADEESTALDAMQRIYRQRGDLAAAQALDQRRLALIPGMSNPTEVAEAYLGASQTGWETGDLAAAIKFCLEALAIAERTDNVGGQWEALQRLVMLHLQLGKLSTAMTYAGQGVNLGPRAGLLEFGEPVEALFRTHLAILHTLQGQAEAAARELAELRTLYPTPETPPHCFALGWLHYESEAWAEARLNLENGQAHPSAFLPIRFDLALRVEVYGHLGDQAALDSIGPIVQAEIGRWNLPYLVTIFNRAYGVLHTHQGDWAKAEAAFKRAMEATRRRAFWYQDARTWLAYGRMLAQRNQPGDSTLARDFLNEAQSMFTLFGTHTLAEKAWIEIIRLS